MLLFVVLLTFLLLMRAFRSVLLPLKAVLLNLVSLGAAFGIIVFIFQKGHGAEEIWDVPATDSIISWIPLMIFAFLYGLSMDYEVFMLTRMREAYDETRRHDRRRSPLGLARTGKLVTSAALVLMFAFFVLSTSPGTDIKQFGIGLAAGIIFDATVIRALLVPAIMRLMGRWNWWLPAVGGTAAAGGAGEARAEGRVGLGLRQDAHGGPGPGVAGRHGQVGLAQDHAPVAGGLPHPPGAPFAGAVEADQRVAAVELVEGLAVRGQDQGPGAVGAAQLLFGV